MIDITLEDGIRAIAAAASAFGFYFLYTSSNKSGKIKKQSQLKALCFVAIGVFASFITIRNDVVNAVEKKMEKSLQAFGKSQSQEAFDAGPSCKYLRGTWLVTWYQLDVKTGKQARYLVKHPDTNEMVLYPEEEITISTEGPHVTCIVVQ